jgi:hypothetical protein
MGDVRLLVVPTGNVDRACRLCRAQGYTSDRSGDSGETLFRDFGSFGLFFSEVACQVKFSEATDLETA